MLCYSLVNGVDLLASTSASKLSTLCSAWAFQQFGVVGVLHQ